MLFGVFVVVFNKGFIGGRTPWAEVLFEESQKFDKFNDIGYFWRMDEFCRTLLLSKDTSVVLFDHSTERYLFIDSSCP